MFNKNKPSQNSQESLEVDDDELIELINQN